MKKSDSQIQQDVIAELQYDPVIDASEIGVAVKDGIVTLNGRVDTFFKKSHVEAAVKRVSGVRGFAEEIEVNILSSSQRTDADIAKAAANALEWHVSIPHEKIKVKVENGWLTLEGELDWFYQKEAAEKAVQGLLGVKGVYNFIHLKQREVSPREIKQKIKEALHRHAEMDANKIEVLTDGGKVTLTGTVDSDSEREDARAAAWRASGVFQVQNNIQVAA